MQNALDRLFYRDRYDYRRALVAFARDLNSDLDVVRLSQRLVARIVETLVVDRMALMLSDERSGDFTSIGDYGFAQRMPRLARGSSMMTRLDGGHTVALDDPIAGARFLAEEVEFWRDVGIYYFVPCIFEGHTIAVLALGRKDTDEPFNSEDLGLLTAVAGQVATAIENGRLYRQLHLKAEELGRMREFNENILESLDDGLVVFDVDERIVRWNRALESFYGVTRQAAVGRLLGDVFDAPFVAALRAARQDHPYGATLYRAPMDSHGADRARLLVNATEVPLQNASGDDAVVGTLLLIEDITDQVHLEEQLQISEKMASIGLLAAGVAHEVNTPLTGISSFTQMLLEGADPADPKTVLLEKIERQTFRAAKIVNGLLNLSRPGSATNERIEVDLNAIITDVFTLLEHQFTVGQHQGATRSRDRGDAGAGHRASAPAGVSEPVSERPRRDAERWLAVGHDAHRRRVGGCRDCRHRAGHPFGAARPHLRSVLHDQVDRPRHRSRPVDYLRHRARARRNHSLRQRCRSGHALYAGAADGRRGPAQRQSELIWPLHAAARFSSSTTKRSCGRFSRRC